MAIGGSLGKLIVSIETDLTNFNRGLSDANSRMQQTRGALVQGTQQIGRAFTVMGAIIVGTFGLATKAAIDFEDAFAGVRKTVDATEEEFAQLSSNFRKLSTEIPATAVELAKIGEIAGQLGIRGVENLTKFTKTIALLGMTTNISGEQAALALSRFTKVIGASQSDIERMGAVIVALGNNFAARESEIIDLSVSLASFGRQVKFSAAEVLAYATVIKAVGGEAQAASSAFQKLALKMKDAVITGNKDLKVFADIAGATADEFSEKFGVDASGAIADFLQGLNKIEKAGGSTTQALAKIGLADIRLIREMGKVIGANEDLRKGVALSSDEWEKNTALTEEAAKRIATAASQLKLLRNVIVDLAITVGNIFLPIIKRAINFIKPIIENIRDWVDENKKLAEFLILATTAVGGLMLALGPLLIILPPIIVSVIALKTAGFSLTTALIAIKTALLSITAVAAVAFVGWKIGERIIDVWGLSDALSGPDGLFTKFLEWWDEKDMKGKFKAIGDEIARLADQAKILLGIPVAPPEVDLGGITVEGGEAPVIPTPSAEDEESFMGFFARISEAFTTLGGHMKTGWGSAITYAKTQMISFQTLLNNVVVTFQKGFAKAISNVVLGITTAKEAVKQLGLQLISMVIEFFAEWVIHQLLAKALGAALTAFTITTAALVASAWAPAAALASLATLGGNAAPAAAALTSTVALAKVLSIPALAEGGIVTKPTLALIGEAGPEAIVPLDKKSAGNRNVINIVFENVNVANDIDMDEMAEMIGQNVEEKLRGV